MSELITSAMVPVHVTSGDESIPSASKLPALHLPMDLRSWSPYPAMGRSLAPVVDVPWRRVRFAVEER